MYIYTPCYNEVHSIEEWGTGINRIIAASRDYQLPETEFLEFGASFRVNIFRKSEMNQEMLSDLQTAIILLVRENNIIA